MEKEKKQAPADHEIQMWADTLEKAEEIKASPEKLKLVKKLIAKRQGNMSKVSSLKELKEIANNVDKHELTEYED